ncbi:MAG: accessory factor UbiK family protein [Azospirillum sp.]|nr:accessory factor UbiK family protein [Azospirillum sp.]MCZ8122442.1 accessory factor UbiK family protein [Magnetospirillum sp.]
MQSDNKILDDLSRAATGALSAFGAIRQEVEAQARLVLERWLQTQNLVAREEFEAIKEMAANARLENERLAERLAAMEAELKNLRTTSGGQ